MIYLDAVICKITNHKNPQSKILLDFFMNSHLLHGCVEFLQLNALWGILLVLGSDVTAGACQTGILMLGALKDYLNAIAFFSH
jgi:hypothetical protein